MHSHSETLAFPYITSGLFSSNRIFPSIRITATYVHTSTPGFSTCVTDPFPLGFRSRQQATPNQAVSPSQPELGSVNGHRSQNPKRLEAFPFGDDRHKAPMPCNRRPMIGDRGPWSRSGRDRRVCEVMLQASRVWSPGFRTFFPQRLFPAFVRCGSSGQSLVVIWSYRRRHEDMPDLCWRVTVGMLGSDWTPEPFTNNRLRAYQHRVFTYSVANFPMLKPCHNYPTLEEFDSPHDMNKQCLCGEEDETCRSLSLDWVFHSQRLG